MHDAVLPIITVQRRFHLDPRPFKSQLLVLQFWLATDAFFLARHRIWSGSLETAAVDTLTFALKYLIFVSPWLSIGDPHPRRPS